MAIIVWGLLLSVAIGIIFSLLPMKEWLWYRPRKSWKYYVIKKRWAALCISHHHNNEETTYYYPNEAVYCREHRDQQGCIGQRTFYDKKGYMRMVEHFNHDRRLISLKFAHRKKGGLDEEWSRDLNSKRLVRYKS